MEPPWFISVFTRAPPFVHILSQVTPVHILRSCFFKIQFNIILLSTSRSPKMSYFFLQVFE